MDTLGGKGLKLLWWSCFVVLKLYQITKGDAIRQYITINCFLIKLIWFFFWFRENHESLRKQKSILEGTFWKFHQLTFYFDFFLARKSFFHPIHGYIEQQRNMTHHLLHTYINPFKPRRTQVSPFTEISILF